MAELHTPATPLAIADHYRGLIDGLVIDGADEADSGSLGIAIEGDAHVDDRRRRPRCGSRADVLAFAGQIGVEGVARAMIEAE